ncbi:MULTISPECIES: recombinase family protein [Bacillus cereus group]|uniref:recombinase family protein n=1 Tax=Bacillus cereus group TaxID=86661 RepID=UPI0008FDEFA7|nr:MULTISPECIES: recombinase family protein [Bacillus cereus group]OJD90532.1 resolvase [Bacillus anthracis]
MKYGYARVSTRGQANTGNSLEEQRNKLNEEGCETIFEEAFTGTKADRPQFQELLSKLQTGDTLVVTKLDRLARNTKEGITIIENLFEQDIKVHVLNVGLLENTTMGRFFLQTLFAVAEMERNLIIERTQEGKAIAKQREDFREGRPNKYTNKQMKHALELLENNSYKQVEQLTGISKSTLIRAKKRTTTE